MRTRSPLCNLPATAPWCAVNVLALEFYYCGWRGRAEARERLAAADEQTDELVAQLRAEHEANVAELMEQMIGSGESVC